VIEIIFVASMLVITNLFWFLFCKGLLKSNKDLTDKLMARSLAEVTYNKQVEATLEATKKDPKSKSVDGDTTKFLQDLRNEPEIINGDSKEGVN